MKSDLAEVQRSLALLRRDGDVIELRIPKTRRDGVISGCFDDMEALARAVLNLGPHPGIYVTINPVNRALLARAENRVVTHAPATTADRDVLLRVWLLIDLDPERPVGVSSSDAEHEAALSRARDIRFVLSEDGWPAPVLIDSGNGAHLWYRIDLPNDDTTTALVKRVLVALAERFDDSAVKVDRGVYNAARIAKLPGTPACKGDDTADRPHRLSRVLEAPAEIEPVTRRHLEILAPEPPPPPRNGKPPRAAHFDLEAFLTRFLRPREPVPYQGGRMWTLEVCPFNPEHQAKDAAVIQDAQGVIGFKCFHDSCVDKRWKDVRALFETPRPPRQNGRSSKAEPTEADRPRIWNHGDLWLVKSSSKSATLFEGYPLPKRGLVMKVGAAKSGKTLLALQEMIALARPRALFEFYRVLHPGPSMLVQMDDPTGSELASNVLRLSKCTPDMPFFYCDRVKFHLGDGFNEWLAGEIRARELRMVVLDSYTALRPMRHGGGDVAKVDQAELSRLDELGKDCDSLIQLIHHDSKSSHNMEWSQQAAGSYAMAAATEAQLHISRFSELAAAAPERLVRVRSRSAADVELVLRFNPETMSYEHVLEGGSARFYPELLQIHQVVGNEEFNVKTLCADTGLSRSAAYRLVSRLVFAGGIDKVKRGSYKLADLGFK